MSPPSEERLAWLTGFTGSAGLAIVLAKEAAVFVDGRYTLQAAKQVDTQAWTIASLADPPPESWLAEHLTAGDRLGLRSVAAHVSGDRTPRNSLRESRRRTGPRREQSGR